MGAKTIRLIYPQWQGGDITRWITEISDPALAARGYFLGAQLLDFLAPDNGQQKFTVPINTDIKERKTVDGVLDRDDIALQTKAALDILNIERPDKIITLVWIDAHPDITLPGDVYTGYHAMAVTACMGLGDKKIISQLPAKISPDKILFVGLRDWERDEIKVRQHEYGIKHLTPEDVATDSSTVTSWLKGCGASHVVVHFDMDVLDPTDIIAAVGVVPNGMKMDEVVRIINDIANEKELVGLTVAEPMPRIAIRLKNMLSQLPRL